MDAHEYTFANGTVVATFNLNAHDLGKATDLITSSLGKQELDQDIIDLTIESSSEEQKQLQIYGEEAFEFITFLMFKETDLEVMKIGDDLVLLDLEVFDIAKEDTFSAFWTTDNGEIISAIGLRSDYESYDVIT